MPSPALPEWQWDQKSGYEKGASLNHRDNGWTALENPKSEEKGNTALMERWNRKEKKSAVKPWGVKWRETDSRKIKLSSKGHNPAMWGSMPAFQKDTMPVFKELLEFLEYLFLADF